MWLEIDRQDDPRPTFYSRVLTMHEQQELGTAIDAMHEDREQSTAELFERGQDLLASYIDGWEHLPEDFSFAKLSYAEVRQLLNKVAYGQFLEPVEKKDLELRPSFVAGSCVANAT